MDIHVWCASKATSVPDSKSIHSRKMNTALKLGFAVSIERARANIGGKTGAKTRAKPKHLYIYKLLRINQNTSRGWRLEILRKLEAMATLCSQSDLLSG